MKRFVVVFVFALASWLSASAESEKSEGCRHMPVSTAADGRFEFIQAPSNYAKAFLLDKYTGRIWENNGVIKDKVEEVEVEQMVAVSDTTRVNYQLYIHGNNYAKCFLLNIHTGDMWKCTTKRGKSVFEKIQMPWNK